jgi:hypothetical protein
VGATVDDEEEVRVRGWEEAEEKGCAEEERCNGDSDPCKGQKWAKVNIMRGCFYKRQ